MKRHVTMELGVIGPTVMANVSRSEQGKGFRFSKRRIDFKFSLNMIHAACNMLYNLYYKLSREIKMDQIKNLRSVNARNYVFIMFQMISIWN